MDFEALCTLGSFFVAWLFSAFAFPLAAVFWLKWGQTWLAVALVLYYGYRCIIPRTYWGWIHNKLTFSIKHHTYFKTQTTIFEDGLPPKPNDQALLCFHPHGILCCGWSVNGCGNIELLKSQITYLGTDVVFSLPVISDMLTWYGAGPASKSNMLRLMAAGKNLALLPGGFEEATFYRYGQHRVVTRRKGFMKYALQKGYAVYPVYTFGEERTFWAFSWLMERLVWLNKFKIPAVLFCGRFGSFMPDNRVHITTVIGSRIQLPKILDPSPADISEWHARYVTGLTNVFEKYKAQYAYEGASATLDVL